MSPPYEDYRQRKRRRDEPTREDVEQQPRTKKRRARSHNYPPEFWDALSKITLTRKALQEFDRRTTEKKNKEVVEYKRKTTRQLRSDTKRLRDCAKNGGPNLSHLRGYADLPKTAASMSQSSSRAGKRTRDSGLPSSDYTGKTSTTGPYDPQFEQTLIDKGVYPDGYRNVDGSRPPKPANLDSMRQALSKTRPSLSPSAFPESAFEDFQDMNRRAKSEAKAMATVIPTIAGGRDHHCTTADNTPFNNLEKFDPSLKMPQPDTYYGARPGQIDLRVRTDLSKYIVPSTSTTLPAVPNYFFEGKSAAGRPDVAQRQVMNDNAYGARAMFQLQNYGKETPVYDGNAYTMGSTYSDGQLKIYATHPRQSASGGTEYHMTQLDTYGMTGNIDTFRRGAAAYRNSRDFTQEQRDRLIAAANATAKTLPIVTSPSSTGSRTNLSFATASISVDSDTSADELAAEYEELPKRQRRRNTITPTNCQTHRVPRKQSQQASPAHSSFGSQTLPSGSSSGFLWSGYFFKTLPQGHHEVKCTIGDTLQTLQAAWVSGQTCPQVYDPKEKRWLQTSLDGQNLRLYVRGRWRTLGKPT